MAAIGTALGDVTLRSHQRIAKTTKYDLAPDAVRADIGGDEALSNFGRGKRKGRVRLTCRYTATEHSARLWPTPSGPWALLELGSYRKPGGWFIPSKRNAYKGGRRHVVVVNGQAYAYVRHPGVAPKRTWTKVSAKVAKRAPEIVDAEVQRALREVIG